MVTIPRLVRKPGSAMRKLSVGKMSQDQKAWNVDKVKWTKTETTK